MRPLQLPSSWEGLAAASWGELLRAWLPEVVAALLLLVGFWVLGAFGARLVRRLARGAGPERRSVLGLLARGFRLALVLVGVISALGTLGIDVTAMVAGLGLTGFALGLALRDVLSNAVSGMLILFYHPFGVGDRIAVAGIEGRVVAVDLRYTVLDTGDGQALIPNASLFNTHVRVREGGRG